MRIRTLLVSAVAGVAALGLTAPTAQANEAQPAAPAVKSSAQAGAGNTSVTVRRPANAAEAPGKWMECRLEQDGGDPHVRTSTGGAGVKAAIRCDSPIAGMTLDGQMYYYWGDWWPSKLGAPSHTQKGPGAKELRNYDTTGPVCANANPTWWYGEFNGTISIAKAGGGVQTDELSLTSTEAELPCGPA